MPAQTEQTTLFEYHDPRQFTTKEFVKTVVLELRRPTRRKRSRLDDAIEAADRVKQIAADRMPSLPKREWSKARPANSVWYAWAKELDHGLPNHTAHQNIQVVRESHQSWMGLGCDGDRPTHFSSNSCVFYYNQPKYNHRGGTWYLSLPLAPGRGEREELPIRTGAYVKEHLEQIAAGEYDLGRGELIRRGENYQFHQSVITDVEVLQSPETYVGVDIGLSNLAATGAIRSDEKTGAELWSGAEVGQVRSEYKQRLAEAQKESRVDKIRDEEHRYVKHICHQISRDVVDWAVEKHRPMIVMEDLTDIRQAFLNEQKKYSPDKRRALHSWPFHQLQSMIQYKALEAGIPVTKLRPSDVRNTSRQCNECGTIDADNRYKDHFECIDCGYAVNADINAAFNIAQRQLGSQA